MTPAIEFDQVWKRYLLTGGSGQTAASALRALLGRGAHRDDEQQWAIRDMSFAVRPGEALGIIGPNGAGKTTILRLLAGITTPTRGRVRANGRIGALINLGAGFQPELTGRENVYLNGVILGMTRREVAAKFDSIVEFSGLGNYLDEPVKRYSAGMYARLGFSVAVHVDPEILLVDEVLAVGDLSFQRKCYERMWSLVASKRAVVFVSHNFWAIKQMCNRAVFIKDGQVVCLGTVDEAIRAYEGWNFAQEKATLRVEAASASPGLGDVEITSIELLDGNGDVPLEFNTLRPFVVRVRYRLAEMSEPVCFSVGAMREDGLHCFTVFSDEAGGVVPAGSGKGVVEARFSALSLLPANYKLYVSAYGSGPKRKAYRQVIVPLQVSQNDRLGADHGNFYNPAVWRIDSNS